jgi:outer membrane protein OmpA-like peptidoglycan-associated protein
MTTLLALLAPAAAQTVDASGPTIPPDTTSPRDPLTTFGGRPVGEGSATILAEGAYDLLLREVRDGPYVRTEPVVDSLFGFGLSGSVGVSRRFGVAVTAPIWVANRNERGGGAAFGDLRLWAPLSLSFQPERHGVSIVPFVRLPTGAQKQYLGAPFGFGALTSLAWHAGPFTATTDLGLEATLGEARTDWPGVLTGSFAGTVGLAGERFGTHVELRARAPLAGGVPSVPSEALLTLRGQPADRLSLALSAGTAVTRGPGAAAPRFLVSGTWSFTPVETTEEAIQVVRSGPVREMYIVDERTFPIQGVTITCGRLEGVSGPEGFADLPLKACERAEVVRFAHPAFVTVERSDLDPEASYWQIVMQRRPVPVAVSVVGPDGEPMLTGAVELRNAEAPAEPSPKGRIDALGVHRWQLAPGTRWVAVMTADRMGGQARVIDLPLERTEPIRVDVVLDWAVDPSTNLTVRVVDGTGQPVEDAAVAVEDRDFGTTGPGGEIRINGLPRGEHALTVRSPVHGDARVASVEVDDDAEVDVVLDWPAGAVVARVDDANGQPLDATVRFQGPAALPERRLGSDGVELLVLRPGTWTLRIESGELGPQERTVVVDDEPGVFREVRATLLPVEPGEAEVVVRVTDARGDAVAGVEIALDGAVVGETGEDGAVTLSALEVGERSITAGGELLVPDEARVELVEGRQVVDLGVAYVPGVVDVRAEENGVPLDVTVTPKGDRPFAPVATGADGTERIVLPPGTWELEAVAADGTVRRRTVEVTGDAEPQEVVFQVLDGPSSVDVTIVDDAGEAVADAEVRMGELDLGRTDATGRLAIDGVPEGPLELVVTRPAEDPVAVTVDVTPEDPADGSVDDPAPEGVVVTLSDAEPTRSTGTRVEVAGPDGPVAATVTLRSAEGVVVRQEASSDGVVVPVPPGSYVAVVEAPGLAAQEVAVEVGAGEAEVVAVDLVPERSGGVVLAVEDADGVPVADAPVFVDDVQVGRTSAAGTISLEEVAPRAVVAVRPDDPGLGVVEVPARAAKGRTTYVAEDVARAVPLVVRDDAGETQEAAEVEVQNVATGEVRSVDGSAPLELLPGTWSVRAEQDGQVAATTVVVPRRGDVSEVVLELDRIETTIVDGRLQLIRPLLFDLDSAALRPDAEEVIDDVARLLTVDRTAALVEVAGHTDDQGGVAYNQALSERRAAAVRDALVARGIEPERLLRRGYGLSRPLAAGDEGRAQNRRVELVVLETAER